HDEYREDGGFPRDQAKHPDTPSRGQYPRPFRYGHCCWQRAHVFPLQFEKRNARRITRTSSPDLPDACCPTVACGSAPPAEPRSCSRGAATKLSTRASTHPTDRCPRGGLESTTTPD